MNRWYLVGGLALASVITMTLVFLFDRSATLTDVGLNLGAEILGMAMTVAIVDWLIEKSKLREEAQRIAWATLHDVDHAVWVWQGGRREFHLDELVAILTLVDEKDPLPVFTKNLFANLGMRAGDQLRLQPRVFRQHRKLKHALQYLAGLAQIREIESLVGPSYIVQALQSSIAVLAGVTGQGLHPTSFGVVKSLRDPSIDAQESRYRGFDATEPPYAAMPWQPAGVVRGPGDPRSSVRLADPGSRIVDTRSHDGSRIVERSHDGSRVVDGRSQDGSRSLRSQSQPGAPPTGGRNPDPETPKN